MNKNIILGVLVGLAPLCLWADDTTQQCMTQVVSDTLRVDTLTDFTQPKSRVKGNVVTKIVDNIRPRDSKHDQRKRKRMYQKMEKQSLDTTLTTEERMAILLKDF